MSDLSSTGATAGTSAASDEDTAAPTDEELLDFTLSDDDELNITNATQQSEEQSLSLIHI